MLTQSFLRGSRMNPFRGWDPLTDFQRLSEEMKRMFEGTGRPLWSDYPPLNVWSNDDQVVVTAELPGFAPENIDISVLQGTLTLRGERPLEAAKQGETYHRRERWNGNFVRSLELPFEVEADKVDAQFAKGLLTIRLPRAAESKPRKIEVKAS